MDMYYVNMFIIVKLKGYFIVSSYSEMDLPVGMYTPSCCSNPLVTAVPHIKSDKICPNPTATNRFLKMNKLHYNTIIYKC